MSTDGPLAGSTVVICRPAADAGSLADRCEALGAAIVLMPLFEAVAPRDDGRALAAALDALARYQWLAITSVNGARAVADALTARRLLPNSLRVAAVGNATAEALIAAGITVDLVPDKATAADLAAAFPPAGGNETVLAPLAEWASSELTNGLHRRGYHVHRVEAYRMELCATDPSLIDGADLAVLTSPSIAARFAAVVASEDRPLVMVCIGPQTATRAAEAGLGGIVIADPHNEDGLMDAILGAIGSDRYAIDESGSSEQGSGA